MPSPSEELTSSIKRGAWTGAGLGLLFSVLTVGVMVVTGAEGYRFLLLLIALAVGIPVILIGAAIGAVVGIVVEDRMLGRESRLLIARSRRRETRQSKS